MMHLFYLGIRYATALLLADCCFPEVHAYPSLHVLRWFWHASDLLESILKRSPPAWARRRGERLHLDHVVYSETIMDTGPDNNKLF